MSSHSISVHAVSDAGSEASVAHVRARVKSGPALGGIILAATIGLALWAAMIWATLQVAGLAW